jgi:hypothetical protein
MCVNAAIAIMHGPSDAICARAKEKIDERQLDRLRLSLEYLARVRTNFLLIRSLHSDYADIPNEYFGNTTPYTLYFQSRRRGFVAL